MTRSPVAVFVCLLFCAAFVWAQAPAQQPQLSSRDAASQQSSAAAATFDQVVDRAIEREHFFLAQMKQLHPLVETYLQNLRTDKDTDVPVPVSDVYFLGRLDMSSGQPDDLTFSSPGSGKLRKRIMDKITGKLFSMYLPLGFAQMAILDQDFQRKYYDFTFVRREFLGEVRCIVMDVAPKKDAGAGHFIGRVWIEDQDYNIVRFNGTYTAHARNNYYFHFDSWRQNMRPGLWLPVADLFRGVRPQDLLRPKAELQGADSPVGLQPQGFHAQLRVHRDHRGPAPGCAGSEPEGAGCVARSRRSAPGNTRLKST